MFRFNSDPKIVWPYCFLLLPSIYFMKSEASCGFSSGVGDLDWLVRLFYSLITSCYLFSVWGGGEGESLIECFLIYNLAGSSFLWFICSGGDVGEELRARFLKNARCFTSLMWSLCSV